MDNIVRRITVVSYGAQGPSAEVVFKKSSKRRKSSKLLKPAEKMQRRMLKAQRTYANEASALHDKHAAKRKDGWLRDAPVIAFKANRRALKELTDF